MNRKQNLTNAIAGFLTGIIFLSTLLFGFSGTSKYLPFDDALKRISSSEVREKNVEGIRPATPRTADSDLLIRLFQILFWLFLISPPIIVVLLLIIISKMNQKNSLE